MTTSRAPGSDLSGHQRLRDALARIRPPPPTPLDLRPCSPFEIAVSEQLKALREDIDQLQTRLWWLFALIIGAAIANVVLGLLK